MTIMDLFEVYLSKDSSMKVPFIVPNCLLFLGLEKQGDLYLIKTIAMGLLFGCGLCCMLLSIWAVLQLIVMGIFFKMEVLAFIEEAEPDQHAYEDYDDFMKQTKANYHKIAINCWVAALIYLITLGMSYWCMKHAKEKDRMAEESLQDDEVFCREKQPKRKF